MKNMKKIFLLISAIFYCSFPGLNAQSFISPDDEMVNGYSDKISGSDYEYQSFIPGPRPSIIIRAESSNDFMEWLTEAPLLKDKKKYAAFIWVAAIGSNPGNAPMFLTTDLNNKFIFNTDGRPAWTIASDDGSSLSFNSIMADQHGDHHGYMVLRIPPDKLLKGKPLRIKVTGSESNLTSWYMTFKKAGKNRCNTQSVSCDSEKRTTQISSSLKRQFSISATETDAKIYANGKLVASTKLKFGYNTVNLGFLTGSKAYTN